MGIKSYHFPLPLPLPRPTPPRLSRRSFVARRRTRTSSLLLLRHFLVYVGGGEIEEIESRLPVQCWRLTPRVQWYLSWCLSRVIYFISAGKSEFILYNNCALRDIFVTGVCRVRKRGEFDEEIYVCRSGGYIYIYILYPCFVILGDDVYYIPRGDVQFCNLELVRVKIVKIELWYGFVYIYI